MGLGLLAALLEGQSQVVQALGRFFLRLGRFFVVVAGGPIVGCGGVWVLGSERDRILRGDVRSAQQIAGGGGLGSQAGLELGGLGEGGEDVGEVVQLDELRGRIR